MKSHTAKPRRHVSDNLFLGTWILDPEQCRYEHGLPPRSGLYRIEPRGNKLAFYMAWTDEQGSDHQMTYTGIPDGQTYPFEKPDIAETITLTQVDAHTLDSMARRGGEVVLHARRVLSSDGSLMTITQSVLGNDGQTYHNMSLYHKQVETTHG